MNCDGSIVLPRAEVHSEWAQAGHDEHEELSDFSALPPEIAKYMPADARSEVKLAFDVATGVGRILGGGSDRAYGDLGPFEIAGSTDVLGTDGDAVVIADFKTGHRDVESAVTNPQLAFYALAAARAMKMERAIVRIIYTKTNRCDEAELDALDLAAFANRLKQLHVRVAALQAAKQRGETAATREGPWCRYCASSSYCPSKNALLVQVASQGLAILGDSTMTPVRAAQGYEQLVYIESLVRDAKKRLETYVDENGPIDLGDGRMYGRYIRNGNEKLDGAAATQAIREIVGGDASKEFESVAIERRTSKAAIERAAKQVLAKRGIATSIIKRIRELGGASHGEDSMPIGEYNVTRDESAKLPAVDHAAINSVLRLVP